MTKERSVLRSRPLVALLTAEGISSLGSQMTFLALPWFVLVTTGSAARMSIVLAAELLLVALLGIPSGTVISKIGARSADARDPAAPRGRPADVSAAPRVRVRARLLPGAALLGAAADPAGACRRRRGHGRPGERDRRGHAA